MMRDVPRNIIDSGRTNERKDILSKGDGDIVCGNFTAMGRKGNYRHSCKS